MHILIPIHIIQAYSIFYTYANSTSYLFLPYIQEQVHSIISRIYITETQNNRITDIPHTNQKQIDTSKGNISDSNSNAIHLYIHVIQE